MAVDASLWGIGRSNSPGWRTNPLVRRPHHHHTQADPRQKGPNASTPICALTHSFDLLIAMVVIKLLLLVAMVVISSSIHRVVFFAGAIALLLCPE